MRTFVTLAVTIGWVGTVIGISIGVPQLVRLAKTRNVEGLSFVMWRVILAANLAWTVHGVRLGQPPMILTNAFATVSTLSILYLLSRHFGKSTAVTVAPGLAIGALMMAVDVTLGSAAYGVAAICLAVGANVGQSLQLLRAPHVRGVSQLFLVLGFVNQLVWTTWSFLVGDPGSMMTAVVMTGVTGFNLTWYVLRRRGLRPLFPRGVTDPARNLVPVVACAEEA